MSHDIRWTTEKIEQRLHLIAPLVYRRRAPIAAFRYRPLAGSDVPPPVGPDVDDGDWPRIDAGDVWGERNTDFVLRTRFRVPADWTRDAPIALHLPLGEAPDFAHPEALAYIDGRSYAGIDRYHRDILLPERWRDGEEHLLALHGFTGIWTGDMDGISRSVQLRMGEPAVVQIDPATRSFIATARVTLESAQSLDDNSPARVLLLNALDDAFKLLDTREPFGDRFYESVGPAHEALNAGIAQAGPAHQASITATGHAHLDLAWLWTLGQTRRKAGRTFHTVMRLMEQFPDYHFTQSQPQLYEYVREDYPDLFDEIVQRIEEGRWEPVGGMWVEADCNVTGPESLARQFLLGQSFFREHFGDAATPVLWLPDVFGYAWNLPQLIKHAGLKYFFTVKIGWSQYNRLPYDSFWWQGLDGTKVLTHFSTTPEPQGFSSAGTYNAVVSPQSALGTWENFQQKEAQQHLLMSFGYGDGGGGPTREMLENLRELEEFPAMPRMRAGSVADFFQRMEAESGDRLPTWNGELYLELHRGTYTTQSHNKRANRKSEFLLHDAEFLAALATTVDRDYDYPAGDLRHAWKLVCLNQFHDIIPGSSIQQVYVESLEQYEEVTTIGQWVRDSALQHIGAAVGGDILITNPTGFGRDDLALWDGQLPAGHSLHHPDGTPVHTQAVDAGTLIAAGDLPPYSVTPLVMRERAPAPVDNTLTAAPALLENDYLRVELNAAGDITSIYDKANEREVLPAGAIANQLQAFEDRPLAWDAWDIDIFYDDTMWTSEPADSIEVVERGPLRATLEIRRRILNSTYVQRISLTHNSAALTFDTTIDWHERHVLLKVAFPVEVLSPQATYEIQWGNVERPTHRNTSWDWARFETCAQKWIDLSEGGYGVSLLNDCKYGHDVRDNVMRMSLLRSPTHPDPEADQGEHRFTYQLLPHAGRWDDATIAGAYALNDPLLVTVNTTNVEPTDAERTESFVSVDQPNVVIETVKQANDGNGIVVRLYESQRRRGTVTVRTGFPLHDAAITNLLEENQSDVTMEKRAVTFEITPYQIVTLRLVPV